MWPHSAIFTSTDGKYAVVNKAKTLAKKPGQHKRARTERIQANENEHLTEWLSLSLTSSALDHSTTSTPYIYIYMIGLIQVHTCTYKKYYTIDNTNTY